ncbi:MAG: hypothetical protein WCI03_03675 [bacterium]
MQKNSKTYSLQALREKLFKKPSWLSSTPRLINDDEENPPAACAVHEKPVDLTREQAIKQHTERLGSIEGELKNLQNAVAIQTKKITLLGQLQEAQATFWGADEARRIEAELVELELQFKAVTAPAGIKPQSAAQSTHSQTSAPVRNYTAEEQAKLNELSDRLINALGTPRESVVRKEVRKAMQLAGL